MPSNFNVIYLGRLPLMDTTRGNAAAESAGQFVGRTFGSEADPLFEDFRHLAQRPGYNNFAANSPTNVYNNDADPNQRAGAQYEYFRTTADGGETWTPHAYDAMATYTNSTITYVDGTTATVQAHIFQDYNGETFWAPQVEQNSFQDAMEAKPIRSLTLGVRSTPEANLTAYRDIWEYAVCFAAGTSISTADGSRRIEALQRGDLILTKDNGLQAIRWIGSRKLSAAELAVYPKLRPIRFKAGALGTDTPASDLLVSPQHRVLVRSKIAQRMFGLDEVLVAAKHLLEIDGIENAQDIAEVEYFHFMFDAHEIVLANGAETESLFTGPEALKAVSPKARDEILTLFPELRGMEPMAVREPARPLVKGRVGRQLADRYARNGQQLVN